MKLVRQFSFVRSVLLISTIRCSENIGGGEFEDEAGADRGIIFNADVAAVFGDDASGDGQAEAGATVFGGKMREEKFVFVLRRDTVASVRDNNFDRVEIGFAASVDG